MFLLNNVILQPILIVRPVSTRKKEVLEMQTSWSRRRQHVGARFPCPKIGTTRLLDFVCLFSKCFKVKTS